MATDQTTQSSETQLRAGLEVRGAKGKLLGSVDEVVQDPESGEAVAFTVRHGLLGRKRKHLPAHTVQRVEGDTAILRFTIAEFKELPDGGAQA
jgi:uncharacterized protein YrrD